MHFWGQYALRAAFLGEMLILSMSQGCRAPKASKINMNKYFHIICQCRVEASFEGSMWIDLCKVREYSHEPIEFRIFAESKPKEMDFECYCWKGASSSGKKKKKKGSVLGGAPAGKTIVQVQKCCACLDVSRPGLPTTHPLAPPPLLVRKEK